MVYYGFTVYDYCGVWLIYCSINHVREDLLEGVDRVDKAYPQQECTDSIPLSIYTGAPSNDFPFIPEDVVAPAVAAAGAAVALGTVASAAPSSLGATGGLGFPTPGFTLAGGGVLPTAILSVCKYYH